MSEGVEEARGKRVLIKFEGKRCIHSRACVLARPDVFVPNVEGQWLHPDAAAVEEIVAAAHACPSGAIRYERLDGGAEERAPGTNTLRLRENGPYEVRADVTIDGASHGYRVALCRCGASQNKPFCDGSHTAAGFTATGERPTEESKPLDRPDGPLAVAPQKNGPLEINGNLEICSGTGRTIAKTTKTWLCRCGASQRKPYCDSTHRKIGFSAP